MAVRSNAAAIFVNETLGEERKIYNGNDQIRHACNDSPGAW